jgi:hypothetical protein
MARGFSARHFSFHSDSALCNSVGEGRHPWKSRFRTEARPAVDRSAGGVLSMMRIVSYAHRSQM